MSEENASHVNSLISKHIQRLRILQHKKAHYGINCPPEIDMEIVEILDVIQYLKQQRGENSSLDAMLKDIENTTNLVVPMALRLTQYSKMAIDLLIDSHKTQNLELPPDLENILIKCDETRDILLNCLDSQSKRYAQQNQNE